MPLYAGISDLCEICGQMIVRKFGCKRNCEKLRNKNTALRDDSRYFLSQQPGNLLMMKLVPSIFGDATI
jgi:hypothetical protein